MELPVYLFTGFLEAGKTKFIQETLEDPRFNAGERTLLLLCEEGVEEYNPDLFSAANVYIEVLEDESQLTPEYLSQLQKKHNPERCVLEYNGMWMLDDLYNNMPEGWVIYQEICFADANTFLSYNANMRQLMVDKLKSCEMVILNRAKPEHDKLEIHKVVRGVSRKCDIAYEMENGDVVYDEMEDPLPFDLEADVIEIKEEDYAIWYRDISEEEDKYDGKTLRFKGMAVKSQKLPPKTFLCGRYLMVCCEDDKTFAGQAFQWDKPMTFETKDWVTVTAKVALKFSPVYEKRGPVLQILSVEPAEAPLQEVATFY